MKYFDTETATLAAFTMTKQRCLNPSQKDYPFYGGRGIKVCCRWLEDSANFLADMGLRPKGMTLDRIDNNGDYTPENCRWVDRKEQANNRRNSITLSYEGRTMSLEEWSAETGIKYTTLKARKQRLGYTDKECLTKSVKAGARLAGKTYKERKKPDMSNVAKGFEAAQAKITRFQARAMQDFYDAGGETFSSVGRRFNVCTETASKICQREGHYAKTS